jgi:hypothetical protein
MTPLERTRSHIEATWAWANLLHAGASKALRVDDPLNAHLISHKAEYTVILDSTLAIMKASTQILDDLAAIEEALDEMDAVDRLSFERDKQFNEDEHER